MSEAFGTKVAFEHTLDGWRVTLPASRVSLFEVIEIGVTMSIGLSFLGFLGGIPTALKLGFPAMGLSAAAALAFGAIGAAACGFGIRRALRMFRAHQLELAGESLRIQPLLLGRPVGKPTMHPLATLGPVEASGPFWARTVAIAPGVHVPVFVDREQVEELVADLGRHIRDARTERRENAPPPNELQRLRGQASD